MENAAKQNFFVGDYVSVSYSVMAMNEKPTGDIYGRHKTGEVLTGNAIITQAQYNEPNNHWSYSVDTDSDANPRLHSSWYADGELTLISRRPHF